MEEGQHGHNRQRTLHIKATSKLGRHVLLLVLSASARGGPKYAALQHGISESTVRRWLRVYERISPRRAARWRG